MNVNVSVPKISLKFFEVSVDINTDYITELGSGFQKIELTDVDIAGAKAEYEGSFFRKYKYLSSGMLYYGSNTILTTDEDWRVTYYKLKTDNKITIVGEKKGNEIVPKKYLKGFENTPIFKSIGEIYTIDEFVKVLKDDNHSFFMIFLIIFLIIAIIGFGLIFLSIKC